MRKEKNIWVIGGDRRQIALAAGLAADGHTVHTFALGAGSEGELSGIRKADCVVLPLPAEREDGVLAAPMETQTIPLVRVLDAIAPGTLVCAGRVSAAFAEEARARGIVLRDYFAREELVVRNAAATAEGALRIAMEELPVTLLGARVLVIGFGRIGKALCLRLRALGAVVTAAARRCEQRAEAEAMAVEGVPLEALSVRLRECELVINTAPGPVLGRAELEALTPGTPVIDLASAPGGVDCAAAAALGVRAVRAPGIPGKESPVSAGGYIRDTVYHIMKELEVQ